MNHQIKSMFFAERGKSGGVPNVGVHKVHAGQFLGTQMQRIMLAPRPRKIVEQGDLTPLCGKVFGRIGADKAGSPRYKDVFSHAHEYTKLPDLNKKTPTAEG